MHAGAAAAGLEDVTKEAARDGRPFLGICVGMQMLFEGSDESPDEPGLGILRGRSTALPRSVRLPQMGWNTLEVVAGSRLCSGLPDPAWCYFVHTYAVEPGDVSVVSAWCDYGRRFPAVVEAGPVWATQFHPEKSGANGLRDAAHLRRGRRTATPPGRADGLLPGDRPARRPRRTARAG
ncbi:MAG: hypothetical protein KatS3mg010_1503 [Acidimicrobiia bacterium]|nr:MAG: hypothetical protein KatS3mg010_1503 [Acidimicrobiia bacterium]